VIKLIITSKQNRKIEISIMNAAVAPRRNDA